MPKTCKLRFSVAQLRAIENGLRLLPHNTDANATLSKITLALGDEPIRAIPQLSRKELLILQALTLGESNKEIARKLVCTESTIKVHMKAVLRKLRLGNRTQAAMWAQTNLNREAAQ